MEISSTKMAGDFVSLKSLEQQSKSILQAGNDLKSLKAEEESSEKAEDTNEKVQLNQDNNTGNPLNDKTEGKNIIDILG